MCVHDDDDDHRFSHCGIKRLNDLLENKDALKHHENASDYIRSFKNDGHPKFNTRNDKFTMMISI